MFHREEHKDHEIIDSAFDIDANAAIPDFDDPSNDNAGDNHSNPVAELNAQIQKNEVKKTERLAKNNLTDAAAVMLYDHIRKKGCDADPIKVLVTLFSGRKRFDNKMFTDLSPLLSQDRIQSTSMLLDAFFEYVRRSFLREKNSDVKMKKLEYSYQQSAKCILQATQFIKCSSIAKEVYSLINDDHIDPLQFHTSLARRIQIIQQQLQHQINSQFRFQITAVCPIWNFFIQCSNNNCKMLHVCSNCGATDHKALDSRCRNYNNFPDWFPKRMDSVNQYYETKRKAKSAKSKQSTNYRLYSKSGYRFNNNPPTSPTPSGRDSNNGGNRSRDR